MNIQAQEIIYQYSPQFLPKVSLRIENLIAYIRESLHENHPIIHHYALKNVIELMKIAEKPELKSRYTKEFIRLEYGLSKILPDQAPELWQKFTETTFALQNHINRFCTPILLDAFLQNMRTRAQENWQECELQIPHLYRWLHQNTRQRKTLLQTWLNHFLEIEQITSIYLNILRYFATYQKLNIQQNYYHQLIGHHPVCQLIILKVKTDLAVIPKIQVGNNSLSIHFLDPIEVEKPSKLSSFPVELGLSRI